jgi:hypothetical protein
MEGEAEEAEARREALEATPGAVEVEAEAQERRAVPGRMAAAGLEAISEVGLEERCLPELGRRVSLLEAAVGGGATIPGIYAGAGGAGGNGLVRISWH